MSLTFTNLSSDTFGQDCREKTGRKGRRHRDALSCTHCRSRKTRCDRKSPCNQCQTRGQAVECTYGRPSALAGTSCRQPPTPGHVQEDRAHFQQAAAQSRAPGQRAIVQQLLLPALSDNSLQTNGRPDSNTNSSSSAHSSPNAQSSPDAHISTSTNDDSTPPSSAIGTPEPELEPKTGQRSFNRRNHGQVKALPSSGDMVAFQGSNFKTRMIGVTHWMSPCNDIPVINALRNRSPEFQVCWKRFDELKTRLKLQNNVQDVPVSSLSLMTQMADVSTLRMHLPDWPTCGKLVTQYTQTYGRIFQVADPLSLTTDMVRLHLATTSSTTTSFTSSIEILRIMLVMAIAMQDGEHEQRLNGRKLALEAENYIIISTRLQKPCIGVVQVLLLLIIMRTISASDTDKMSALRGLFGLTSQVAFDMGLHRDPALFDVPPYFAEARKRLWGCLVRLNLDYCIRSGTQLMLRLEDADCPLPTLVDVCTLQRTAHEQGSRDNQESDNQAIADAAFGLVATKVALIIAPMQQNLLSSNPRLGLTLQRELQTSFESIISELPPSFQPSASSSDPIQELQKAIISINMQSFLSILALATFTAQHSVADHEERGHLLDIWDHSISILQHFQGSCGDRFDTSNPARTTPITFHLLWTNACRAALTACWAIVRLRNRDIARRGSLSLSAMHSPHAVRALQQPLTASLDFLCQLFQSRACLGPVVAKTSLVLAIVNETVASLHLGLNGTGTQDKLLERAVVAAERTVSDMTAALRDQQTLTTLFTDLNSDLTTPFALLQWPEAAVATTAGTATSPNTDKGAADLRELSDVLGSGLDYSMDFGFFGFLPPISATDFTGQQQFLEQVGDPV
ncbi:hypothetical protein B0T19DRAFT_107453 [Cercophora scortea]|uniref:Zn(2)-C6 fungal-type domain-containing protein n=1 Tax=Cercophora scortea TaxID=314031 RepID=A0AAE0MHD9_9PEZI|nr:hypothetical protein B0T19DRAFT_107453 [Cercophora scortea]